MNRAFWAPLWFASVVMAQAPAARPPQPPFIREGQSLLKAGRLQEALELYQKELKTSPDSIPANNAAGIVLDMMGRGPDARNYFAKVIEVAPDARAKAAGERGMEISYAYEGDCANAVKHGQRVFDYFAGTADFFQQGEMANETARVCIDSGDLETARKWYQMGHDSGLKQPDIPPDRKHLWEFRWEHAQARIAARQGKKDEALRHMAAAKALLDQDPVMAKPQAIYYPYLAGYVALYTGDYTTARDELLKAAQYDPFIQCLLGQTYEKLGEPDKAMECYHKAALNVMHNPPAAYTHRITSTKLAAK